MKFQVNENKFFASVTMTPETPAEAATLLRISKNAKAQKPEIYFFFNDDKPYCNIRIPKLRETKQVNYVSNKRK